MKNLPLIFEAVNKKGGEIWIEKDKLKYRFPPNQDIEKAKDVLKQVKGYIIRYLELEKELINEGWIVGSRLDTYEFRLTKNHSIYLFNEKGRWLVWWATWNGKSTPTKQKVVKKGLELHEAINEAHRYIEKFKENVEGQPRLMPTIERIDDAIW